MSWINEIKNHTVAEVAAALGYPMRKRAVGCPACRTAQRGRGDRRPPAGLRPDGLGWRCHVCNASGDAADFAAYALVGKRCAEIGGLHGAVSRELANRGLVNTDEDRKRARATSTPLAIPAAPVAVPRQHEPRYLTNHQLREAAGVSLTRDHYFSWELRERGINPDRAIKYGFRVLVSRDYLEPHEMPGPDWRRGPGGRWFDYWRLLCPLVDAGGYVRSLRGRNLRNDPKPRGDRPKTVAPTGYATRGLCYADPVARAYLRNQRPAPRYWVVTEGEFDFLAWGANLEDLGEDRADFGILGVISGSWSQSWTDRILTRGAEVWLRTDPDSAGDAYALQIEREAWSRGVTLQRDSVRDRGDDGDRWAAGETLESLTRGHRSPAEIRAQIRAREDQRRALEEARR